jgi:O-antigen ligase
VLDWGRYPLLPSALILVAMAGVRDLLIQPSIRLVIAAGVAAVIWMALTATPLPETLVDALSPARAAVGRELALVGGTSAGWPTLSLAPMRTWLAAVLVLAAVAVFVGARGALALVGVRALMKGLALVAAVVALEALVQYAFGTRRVLGLIEPASSFVKPFGVFFNRSDFGTWAVLTTPVVAGYALWSARDHWREVRVSASRGRAFVLLLNTAALVPLIAVALLVLAINVSGSRSAIVGLAAAAVAAWTLRRRSATRRRTVVALAIVAIAAIGALVLSGSTHLLAGGQIVTHAFPTDRVTIWRESWAIVADFWLTGTGVGGFGTAMLAYQETDGRIFFNHAHSQYLQWAAEGGVVLLVAIAVAAVALARAAQRSLGDGGHDSALVRIGAIAALAGVAVQSIWHVVFSSPANVIALAVVAAIATHQPAHRDTPRRRHMPGVRHAETPRHTR